MISKDEAISQFRQIIGQKASWVLLMGSQFVAHLAIFVSWCLREALWRLERLNQEFFFSTALNRSSILAHVEDREYIPRKRTPSVGINAVRITNNGAYALPLPLYTPFLSEVQLDYVTTEAVLIPAGQSVLVGCKQMRQEVIETVIDQEKAFYKLLISKELSKQLCEFEVLLDVDGNGYEPWQYARLFQNAGADSTVYDEFYSHTDQVGIRFGNGKYGVIPPLGTKLKLNLWLTEGETSLVTDQTLSIVGEYFDNGGEVANITVVTVAAIEGGGAEESIEEMQAGLHYWSVFNEKIVWGEDYEYFVKKYLTGIVWIKVWGEQEQEVYTGFLLSNINKIFISAYAPANTDLGVDVNNLFSTIRHLNKTIHWVPPSFSTFSLNINGKVARTVIISDAIQTITDLLDTTYGKDSPSRKTQVFIKDFYRLIESTGLFDDPKAEFTVIVAGVTIPTYLYEMVHIDLETSIINLTYL